VLEAHTFNVGLSLTTHDSILKQTAQLQPTVKINLALCLSKPDEGEEQRIKGLELQGL
jgi:hypothetical protein